MAPMVRVGTLPMRLLALEYGADLVWSPEVVDKGLVDCKRVINEKFNTIDYINSKNSLVFRTRSCERDRLIFQLGSSDPEIAVRAAKLVAQDVAAIDLNCGCPKDFSLKGGMGAALLKTPDLLKQILLNLVAHSGKPVTCKIRILDSLQKTIDLVKMIESTGVACITVHCRTPLERPRDKGHWEIFGHLAKEIKVPLIANGDIFSLSDARMLIDSFRCSSAMIARACESNPSVFRKEGSLPRFRVAQEYIYKCIETDNPFNNTKYVLMHMFNEEDEEIKAKLFHVKSYDQIFDIFQIEQSVEDAAR